ncbi:MAG: RNA polymerase factor sigma-54 [Deltaproteobacteria bacterium]|nr:RNA polymerase factor sigma-54 [Deltaproteobacteria bacterium]MBW1953117.1 RNA polymerase factor sigma-54 [Deltaproteobacteria bacterium]MBW1986399.1 RNA polymerase factor sigma-54 [Deltaproteobacteria bacterium]MBW2133794.1 RNA polymerase factor sigma-54 [Deltaproteobacteria bacterium]
MALEIKQSLKLTQQLIMTPQLQQAIKLLQLSRLELLAAINQELETNPILEEVLSEEDQGSKSWELGEENVPEKGSNNNEEVPLPEVTVENRVREDFEWGAYLEDKISPPMRHEYEERETPSFENVYRQEISLKSHLLSQLQLAEFSDQEKYLGTLIIGNLDEDGYLRATVEDLAREAQADPEEVEAVLREVQEFDPVGVAARDLKECLLIQVRVHDFQNPLIEPIIVHHLRHLENKNYLAIAQDLKTTLEEVSQAVELITQLEPKPGRSFDHAESRHINPDIFVYKMGDDYVVTLNDDGLPRLRVSSFYQAALTGQPDIPETTRNYIQSRLKSAVWFIKSIQQRQRTIYRVSKSIVNFQRQFLDQGIAHLKPLTLRQVAEDVQLHESTISRVTTNKYMHTPQGVFELKFFFNSGITRTHGDQVASESVKEKIRQIVQSEDGERPYSDQDIADMLKDSNILIARRTVAKYREMLGLLSSNKRKKPTWRKNSEPRNPLS